jgi:hypothetical protein
MHHFIILVKIFPVTGSPAPCIASGQQLSRLRGRESVERERERDVASSWSRLGSGPSAFCAKSKTPARLLLFSQHQTQPQPRPYLHLPLPTFAWLLPPSTIEPSPFAAPSLIFHGARCLEFRHDALPSRHPLILPRALGTWAYFDISNATLHHTFHPLQTI